MSLKIKIAAVIVTILVFTTIVYFGIFRLVVLKSFDDLDNRIAGRDMGRCVTALTREIRLLDRLTHDWSSWDDCYRFAARRNQDFVKENLVYQVFPDQHLNLIHIYDTDLRLIWGKTYDLASQKELPLDLSSDLGKAAFSRLAGQKTPGETTYGVVQTRYGPMIIAANPILTTRNKGPSHGAVLMGRFFNDSAAAMLSEQVSVRLRSWPVRSGSTPDAVRRLADSFKGQVSIRIVDVSKVELRAYALINDILGDPAMILEASIPRDIMNQGRKAYGLGMLFIIGTGIVMLAAVSGTIAFMVLRPIVRLKENVQSLGDTAGDAKLFETLRKDEVGILSREFGTMVKRLSESKDSHRESRERLELALKGGGLGFWDVDLRTMHTVVNERWAEILGYSLHEIADARETFINSIHEDDRERVLKTGMDFRTGEIPEYEVEYRAVTKQGRIVWLVSKGDAVARDADGTALRMAGTVMDITARKMAEEELRYSEERFRQVAENAGEFIWEVDEDGLYRYCSSASERILGYLPEELVGKKHFYDLFAPETMEGSKTAAFAIFGRAEPFKDFVNRCAHRDGRIVVLATSGAPVLDADGALLGYRGTDLDITERIQAQESLSKNEATLTAITSSARDAIIMIDDSGAVTFWNAAAEQILGWDEAEVLGCDLHLMIAPRTYHEACLRGMESFSMTGRGDAIGKTLELRALRRDNTEVPIELSLSSVQLAGRWHAVGIMRDITGRKRTEEELEKHRSRLEELVRERTEELTKTNEMLHREIEERILAQEAIKESEKRFRSLIHNSSDIVVILDKNGIITYDTPSMDRILGYPPVYFIGRDPLEYIHPDDLKETAEALSEVYQGTNPGIPTEFRFRRADGTWAQLEALGQNLIDYQGINGVVITARDITERKKAEVVRLDMERRLSNARRLESLGMMAGGIAHDFNNLLMAIMGSLELAGLDLPPTSRPRSLVKKALEATSKAAQLTNQMLTYTGRIKLDISPCDLSGLVTATANILKGYIPGNISLELRTPSNLPAIIADSKLIQQALINLVVNAAEAIDEHEGTITIATGAMECEQDYLDKSRTKEKPSPGIYAFMDVTDTGCGMDEQTREMAFDPFFSTKFLGRGLGMAEVLGIVSGHKGAIIVATEPANGTTVRVLFPVESFEDAPSG